MTMIVIIGIVCFVALVMFLMNLDSPEQQQDQQQQGPMAVITTTVTEEEDNDYYPIRGINYADIDASFLGDFTGYVQALKANRHDPYAIGVYCHGRRVGFLPRGQRELHAALLEHGGKADAEGFIKLLTDDDTGRQYFSGKVRLL